MDKLIIEIAKWLIPVGGLGSVVVWLLNRNIRELELIKKSHDTFKQMYEDINEALTNEVEEKKQLRKAVISFEKALSKMFVCKHYSKCPVNLELKQNSEPKASARGQPKRKSSRQSGDRGDLDNEDYHC